ncbi:BON domain-containing protein [Ornithinimicrobium murale]|uniref:BON domain-containing protein n=1 Tax=Ornithinimicrobium murale TaxID=1050153 RepID=UPI000E0CDC71|nr:BON domain-containing protein [Ornithinimicrobium murale]
MDTSYQLRELERRLAEDRSIHELGVHLQQRGGRVFVSGTVASEESRSLVLAVVREACPGHEVVDDLACDQGGLGQPPESSEAIR